MLHNLVPKLIVPIIRQLHNLCQITSDQMIIGKTHSSDYLKILFDIERSRYR